MKKTIAEMGSRQPQAKLQTSSSLCLTRTALSSLANLSEQTVKKTGVVSGYGYVDGAVVYAYAQDTSVNAGAGAVTLRQLSKSRRFTSWHLKTVLLLSVSLTQRAEISRKV